MNDKKALIFDFDGVIADTEPFHWRSWVETLEPRGISLSWEQYCQIGRGYEDASMIAGLRNSLADSSVLSGIEDESGLRRDSVRRLCAACELIHTDTISMLLALEGHSLGLVTSSARYEVEPILKAAGIWGQFDALVFGGDVKRRKPAPDPYLLVADRLAIESGLVFEDSDAGMESARQAGFTVIPVADPRDLANLVSKAISAHAVPS